MKYVFIAHSHTLVLCSLGTINYLNLPHEDCIFLATRNYKMPKGLTDVRVVDANDVFNEFNKDLTGSIIQNWKDIKRFDTSLKNWTDNDVYNFYTPHLFGGIFILIASYKKCLKVSFVQEGAYTIPGMFINNQSLLKKIYRWLVSLRRYGSFREYACSGWYTDGCLPFQKTIDLFATTDSFFQYMPKNKCVYHQIKWPGYKGDIFIEHPDAPIFIFDGYIKNGVVDSDVYKSSCMRLIEDNCRSFNYIKFHPAQSSEECRFIEDCFKKCGVLCEIFTESKPFEFYIAGCSNLHIIGFSSSLMYYAKDAGHNVIARTSWLLDSPKFRLAVKNGYPVFDNN